MDTSREEVKRQCLHALLSFGASQEFCEFYAEVLQCEHDITHNTYELLKELREENSDGKNGTRLFSTIQKMSKNFNAWKNCIQLLSAKQISAPATTTTFDPPKFSRAQKLKAVCSLETKEVKLKAGDEMVVTDASNQTQLKVRNARGEEGYVPALSCAIPTPDGSAVHALERLQIQLLTSWTDCITKLRPILHQMLVAASASIITKWMNCGNSGGNSSSSPWEERVSRRLKRIDEIFSKEILPNEGINLSRLHKTLCSLENELIWQKDNHLASLIETVSCLDKTVLCYQSFRTQWHLFRKILKESVRPIRIVSWDPDKFDTDGNLRYYELKLTAEEILTKEETTYVTAAKRSDSTGDGLLDAGDGKRTAVSAEQLESRSHEENRRFVVRSVIDPRDGLPISIKEAVAAGVVDHQSGMYVNPATGQAKTIAAAMNDGLIQIEYAYQTTKTPEKIESIGLITIRTQVDNREYTITGAVDPRSGDRLEADEARRRGVVDETAGYYVNEETGERVPLDDAVERELVFTQYHDDDVVVSEPQFEMKTYAISAVVDQLQRKPVPFVDAIRRGLIDRETGNYVNNATGEKVFAAEAIRRGFLKSVVVDDPSSLNIDATNKVVVDRIDRVRKNVLRGVRVISAFSRALKAGGAADKKVETKESKP